jgi:hypothetical protein
MRQDATNESNNGWLKVLFTAVSETPPVTNCLVSSVENIESIVLIPSMNRTTSDIKTLGAAQVVS